MKNLLSMLAVSTLVGTSASNLNPVFTNATVNHGFKSNKLKNQDISIKNKNNTNPFIPKQLPSLNEQGISSFAVDSNDNIYAGTNDGLYKSTDGINFKQVNDKINSSVNDITIQNKIIYVSTNNDGLWKSTDGINFKQVNKQNYIRCLAVDSNDNIYAGTTSYGLLKSTDGGNYFSRIDNNIKMDFVNKIIFDHHNNIWVACDNGLYKSTDGINFEQVKVVLNTFSITSIAITIDGKIYAGTKWKGLYKSTDGINFNKINTINNSIITGILITKKLDIYVSTNGDGLWKSNGKGAFDKINESPNNIMFNSLVVTSSNVVYMGTYKGNGGIWTINLIEQLIKVNKPDNFDKSWLLYSGIVYNSAQKIDIKENLVASATLDGKSQTVPKIGLDIPVGEHNLILTLKDKTLASVFGGEPNTGQVTYKLWVKTSIDKNKIDYQTKIDDTQLYTGLVSNTGNTKSKDIIQTKIKDGTGTHNASINLSLNDNLIDFDVNKSFYEQGTVDSSNNFIENPSSKKTVSQNLSITTDGIYHLHLEDTVGNIYDSYLELGESNWKLKGTFNDSELDKLKTKLNVTVNITDPSQKAKALGWLHQYENFVENKFNETIKTNGKGFDSEIKKQITSYTAFLKPLIYDISNEPKFDDGLDKDLLVKTITDKAKEILNKGLDELPKNLNVNTSNVVNKSTLDSYSIWIKGYDIFINNNKDQWINDVVKVASRGFATEEQKQQVVSHIRSLDFKNYLEKTTWTPNLLLNSFNDNKYLQYIKLDKLQSDTIDWVNTNMSEINTAYQNAIKQAESGLNLHGYSIDKILNDRPKPQTKSEIDNFADGKSYHDWLQSQANIKFRGWQLAMGFGIAIPLLLVVVAIGWIIRSRTNPRYNGVARARKDLRQERKQMKKKIIKK